MTNHQVVMFGRDTEDVTARYPLRSFSLTVDAIEQRTKTVTRRWCPQGCPGWQVGKRYVAADRLPRSPGPLRRLAVIEVVRVDPLPCATYRDVLDDIMARGDPELVAEGLPHLHPTALADLVWRLRDPSKSLHRVEFRYVP